jgi:hypothetical protein
MPAELKNRVWLAAALASVLLVGCSRLESLLPQPRTAQSLSTTGDIPSYGEQPSETEYRAVLMSDGMVLFGKLRGLGTPFPVLTNVYYVQTVRDPNTNKATSVLIKRGKEWHSPDRTVLNASQIILIEPVTADSKVMQLISQQEKK